jgi:hypothetical protein
MHPACFYGLAAADMASNTGVARGRSLQSHGAEAIYAMF